MVGNMATSAVCVYSSERMVRADEKCGIGVVRDWR
jgi:hypothetical protein